MSDDYDFSYSDDDSCGGTNEEEEVQTENKYYSSKALIEAEKYAEALAGFLEIVDSGEEGKEWHFKALKQVVKIKVLSKDADVTDYFKRFLEASTVVTRNAAEKKINSLLDYVSSKDGTNNELLEQFYTSTLQGLADAKNDRLYFKTSVKLAHLYLASGQEDKAMKVVDELLVKTEEGGQRLEVYALQIELLGSRGDRSNNALLQATYRKALAITSAIPHPRVLGVIREYGGKMHMNEKNWEEAATDFFESFKAYDEAGSPNRSHCLKYLVLANMMMESSVDPFDSQEARPYKTDPVVAAMTSLVAAYQSSDILAFEEAVKHKDIAGDAFVAPYIDDLRKKVCSKVILKGIGCFTRVKLDHVKEMVGSSEIDVDELLLSLILDKKIEGGRINQYDKVLEIERQSKKEEMYRALAVWSQAVSVNAQGIGEGLR